jgi:hypothetical protein
MDTQKINGIPLREAESNDEKILLGFLNQEAERVDFGQIVVEFQIRNGRVVHMRSTEVSRTLNVGKPS